MKRLNNQGIGHIIILLAVVVIVVVAFAGWRVTQSSTSGSNEVGVSKAAVPGTIKNMSDLQKASNALDTAPIDKNLDTTSLDSAVNNLL